MHVSAAGLAILLAAAVAGATVQGSIGFGMNLTLVPVVAIVRPDALPAATIVTAFPMTLMMVAREHSHVHWAGVGWITAGRLPGVVLGAWVVTAVSATALSGVVGVLVILAAAMSAVAPAVRVDAATCAAAGFTSGAMGTASSIGGPPVALLYQHHAGPALRSTLAAAFMIGTLMSIGALAVAGEVTARQVALGAALVPGIAVGVALSSLLHRWLDRRWLRPAVLTFAVLAGATALARALG